MSIIKKQYSTYLFFVSVLLLTSLLLVFAFRVKKVSCYQPEAKLEELTQVCQDINAAFVGKSLLFFNFSEAEIWQELAEKSDYSQLYYLSSLKKIPPGELVLDLDSKLPDYRLRIINEQQEEQSFILNQNSHLKKDLSQSQLFTIVYHGDEEILSKNKQYLNDDYHQFFLSLKTSLDYYQINAKNLIWRNNDLLELDLGKSYLVILDKHVDPKETIKKLALILEDKTVIDEIQKQGVLDLRFNLPVIREKP
ncbi:MAG: hypothetical protein GX559_01260 [Candidatus Pacebacteria bacterium]|nr:hypothetical protein [Candidatus Paceibacterota bacterium]